MNLKNAKLQKPKVKKATKKANTNGDYNIAKNQRIRAIQECKQCNGKPPEVPFELETMEGFRCGICFEVLGWKKK